MNNFNFKYRGLPIGIGSLPYTDPQTAVAKVLQYFSKSPFWPELPRRDWRESMGFIQTEGLPGMVVDRDQQRIYVNTSRDLSAEMEDFYSRYLSEDLESFAITPDYAAGFHTMFARLSTERPSELRFLKSQLSGPTTFGLIIKDETGKALLYNEHMMDVLLKGTIMKAKWMLNRGREANIEMIIFFDEPMLQSIGSPTVPIDREQVVNYLNEIVDSIDCLTGAHCCGNTDWSILMGSNINIIHFDAFHFVETMTLYPKALQTFLDLGGALAWGIVPASAEASAHDVSSLISRLDSAFEIVARSGIDKQQLMAAAVVAPSCGLGSLSSELSDKILEMTSGVAEWLQERS